MKLAVIFNGQGAHYEGMGLDFAAEYKEAEDVFKLAENSTAYPIREWIEKNLEKMKETRYAQPAISAVSTAIYESIKEIIPKPAYMAGLSLGEYSALLSSGMLSYEDGFQLLKKRGSLMTAHCQELKENSSVQMLAVIGMPFTEIKAVVDELNEEFGGLYIANMNSSLQTVLAGSKEAVKAFNRRAKEGGYKKGIPLKVEGPFHSPLMAPIQESFEDILDETQFHKAEVPVISNTTLQEHQMDSVKESLVRHLTEPVHWKQTIDLFKAEGVTHIIQIGPGKTLANLLKKEENVPQCLVVDKVADVESIEPFLK